MQITSRFTIAIHILSYIHYYQNEEKINSDILSSSIGVNPVIIRTVISQLRNANIVATKRGSSGAKIIKPLDQITFYDLYQAVDDTSGLFRFHEAPNPNCPIGKHIHNVVDSKLVSIQQTMHDQMRSIKISDVILAYQQYL